MSNWDFASEAEIEAGRQAYDPSDAKHPDYSQTLAGEFIEWAEQREKEKCMELEVLDHQDQIILFTGNPAERMRQMQETAAILAEPVRQRHTVTISGREHVRVEGWTMLGALLGVHPYLVWTRPGSTKPDSNGWEARVEASTIDGRIVGSAEAMCLVEEPNWKNRDEYALRSMAQTRATSKALRQPLGFVITLAGFDPTPAEEMPSHDPSPFKPPAPRADGPGDVVDYLTGAQNRKIHALKSKLVKAEVFTEETFDEALSKEYGATISGLTRKDASHLIERLEKVENDLPET